MVWQSRLLWLIMRVLYLAPPRNLNIVLSTEMHQCRNGQPFVLAGSDLMLFLFYQSLTNQSYNLVLNLSALKRNNKA